MNSTKSQTLPACRQPTTKSTKFFRIKRLFQRFRTSNDFRVSNKCPNVLTVFTSSVNQTLILKNAGKLGVAMPALVFEENRVKSTMSALALNSKAFSIPSGPKIKLILPQKYVTKGLFLGFTTLQIQF